MKTLRRRLAKYMQLMSSARDKLIFGCFAAMPLVDSLNGLLRSQGLNTSVAIIYRLFLILILLVFAYKKVTKDKIFGSVAVLMGISLLAHLLLGAKIYKEFYLYFYWLFFPLLYLVIYELKEKKILPNHALHKLFYLYSLVVSLTIIIPKLIGMGRATYSGGQGFAGFYISNNGISYFVCILLLYSTYCWLEESTTKRLIPIALLIISATLIGTMACLGTVMLSVFGAIFSLLRETRRNHKKTLMFIALLIGILILVSFLYFDSLQAVIIRRAGFFQTHGTAINAITSGRSRFLLNNIALFQQSFGYNAIFGMGVLEKTTEMDIFDIIFEYGFVAAVVYSIFVIKAIKQAEKSMFMWLLILYTLAFSSIVGHVFTNTMASTIFALFLNMNFCNRKEVQGVFD